MGDVRAESVRIAFGEWLLANGLLLPHGRFVRGLLPNASQNRAFWQGFPKDGAGWRVLSS